MRELGVRCANLASGARTKRQVRELAVSFISLCCFFLHFLKLASTLTECHIKGEGMIETAGGNCVGHLVNNFVFASAAAVLGASIHGRLLGLAARNPMTEVASAKGFDLEFGGPRFWTLKMFRMWPEQMQQHGLQSN